MAACKIVPPALITAEAEFEESGNDNEYICATFDRPGAMADAPVIRPLPRYCGQGATAEGKGVGEGEGVVLCMGVGEGTWFTADPLGVPLPVTEGWPLRVTVPLVLPLAVPVTLAGNAVMETVPDRLTAAVMLAVGDAKCDGVWLGDDVEAPLREAGPVDVEEGVLEADTVDESVADVEPGAVRDGVPLPVTVELSVVDGVPLPVIAAEGVTERDGVQLGVPLSLAVAVAVPDLLTDGELLGKAELEADRDVVCDAVAVGEPDGEGDGDWTATNLVSVAELSPTYTEPSAAMAAVLEVPWVLVYCVDHRVVPLTAKIAHIVLPTSPIYAVPSGDSTTEVLIAPASAGCVLFHRIHPVAMSRPKIPPSVAKTATPVLSEGSL